MTFKLNCQVIDKLDEEFQKNLILFENKKDHSSRDLSSNCSQKILELVSNGAKARYEVMEKYSELISAIEKYEKLTSAIDNEVSKSCDENSDPMKLKVVTVSNENTTQNIERQVSEKDISDSVDKQNLPISGHLQDLTSEVNKEYVLDSFSIPQPPELNFNY